MLSDAPLRNVDDVILEGNYSHGQQVRGTNTDCIGLRSVSLISICTG